jgi:hypothetical protein
MPDSVECGGCGTQLSEEYAGIPRKQCPECGAMNRVFSRSADTRIIFSETSIASQRYGHTGREVLGAEAQQRAVEWASLANRDELLSHQVAEDFRALLSSAPCLSGDSIVLFRGQGIRDGEPVPPSIERMGPLPLHRTPKEGRYHRQGERVLYLADSLDGVQREMDAWCTQGMPYVILVEVPLAPLRIADFSDWPSDHLLTAVFSRAEMCNVPQRGPANYVFSQTVGNIVSEHFDGMRIPGVRGAPGAHYKNVVLFRPLAEWPKWTSPAEPAFRLISPIGSTRPHEHIAVAAYYLWEKDGQVHGRDQAHWFQGIKA